jgi:hypothetical protein
MKIFETVRDIPYKIPLSLDEEDTCCSGKHKLLKDLLTKQGFKVRYRVCSFVWSSMNLPDKVSRIPHDENSQHIWLEVLIDNRWVTVDATWDIGIKKIFHVNEWDGQSDTEIAVQPLEVFTPERSASIIENESDEDILNDLRINKDFYEAFNNWLAEQRIKI